MLDQVFDWSGRLAMLGWAILIFIPRWRGVARAVARVLIPSLLSVAYLVLIATSWSRAEGGFGSLDEVQALFGSRPLLLAGWIHYLAFDLFVGSWVVSEGQARRIPHLVLVPILILTLLFGPIGFLTFVAVAAVWRIGGGWRPSGWLREHAVGVEPKMMSVALFLVALAGLLGIAAWVDDRTFLSANVWFKPLKFAMSTAIYLATLAWFWQYSGRSFREGWGGRVVVWGSIVTALGEVVYIAWRASRSEASHYNVATPSGAIPYAIMGVGALILSSVSLPLALGIWRNDAPKIPPVFRLAVVLGLVLFCVLSITSGIYMAQGPGHNVGVVPANDHPLPFVGWSAKVGDLRIPHFFGMHVLQAVPIVGAVVAGLRMRHPRTVLVAFSSAYVLAVLTLFLRASQGLAFLSQA